MSVHACHFSQQTVIWYIFSAHLLKKLYDRNILKCFCAYVPKQICYFLLSLGFTVEVGKKNKLTYLRFN